MLLKNSLTKAFSKCRICLSLFSAFWLALLFFGAAATPPAASAQTCTPAPIGLRNWYAAENSGADIRGAENATVNGGTYTAGKVGQAFNFNGTNNNYAQASTVAALTSLTMDAWIYPRSYTDSGPIFYGAVIFEHGNSGSARIGYDLNYGVYINGGYLGMFQQGSVLPLNQWSHVAVTADAAAGTVSLYVNGALTNTKTNVAVPTTTGASSIGYSFTNQLNNYNGLIDETEFFDRALSQSEIAAIYNAGSAGKCKPTAILASGNLAAWIPFDGDARDLSGNGNNGVAFGSLGYQVGKVGQSLNFDGSTGYIDAGDANSLEATTNQITLEAWIKPTDTTAFRQIISKFGTSGNYAYQLGIAPNGVLRADFSQNGTAYEELLSPSNAISANVWTHVAATFNAGATVLYINGVQAASGTLPITSIYSAGNTHLNIGRDPVGQQYFAGAIDEPSVYTRALTTAEISAIYNAGLAGKLKQAATNIGGGTFTEVSESRFKTNKFAFTDESAPQIIGGGNSVPQAVSTTIGDATVTFPTVTTAGVTQQIPLDLSGLPALPPGATSTGLNYDIATSAVYTGSPTVCFNVPALAATFSSLRIYHLEGGVWVNRTAASNTSPNLCTTGLSSLSPFAVVQFLAPTAAGVSISGRVVNSRGVGISGATVTLSVGSLAQPITARTNAFGFYRLDDVPAGNTYILSANAKRYAFQNPTRVINLQQSLTNEDFIAY